MLFGVLQTLRSAIMSTVAGLNCLAKGSNCICLKNVWSDHMSLRNLWKKIKRVVYHKLEKWTKINRYNCTKLLIKSLNTKSSRSPTYTAFINKYHQSILKYFNTSILPPTVK